LARRHLLTALSIGAAALASKAAQAQLLPLTWEQHQDLIWGLPANEIDHYQVFYRTPYPQSLFNQTIDALGPPPRDILQQLNANPAQTGSPLGIPAGYYTTYFPGYYGLGSGGASRWAQHQELIWGLPANEIDHYQVFYRTPYPQSLFNQTIDALGPPPRDILQQLNGNPAQAGSPLVVPAGDYTTYFPGFWPSGSQGASGSCFLRGTQIATPSGERRIEELAIGDPVITSGGVAYKIQWIGRRLCAPTKANLPVRFAGGSLAPNLPHADLRVSQEHALLIDGLLIRAIELVNGMSITIDPCESLPEIEYLHIKLANPDDLIFAEGVGSETLMFNDRIELRGFDNGEEYRRLYGLPEIGRRGDVVAFYRAATE
jgi:hypothetical protein